MEGSGLLAVKETHSKVCAMPITDEEWGSTHLFAYILKVSLVMVVDTRYLLV
jgi:hypothetical protein